jgi:murein hydrolase activator
MAMAAWRVPVILLTLAALLLGGSLAGAAGPSFAEQQAQLRDAKVRSADASARAAALERAAGAERDRARQAQAQEAAAAERIRAAEAELNAAEARVRIIDRLLAAERSRAAGQQAPVLRLVAALQAMARRPALLGLVQPGSAADMVHVRAVLGTTLPIIARRSAAVRAELARVRRLRLGAAQAATGLRASRARLEAERVALVQLEATHRLRSQALGQSALVESDRAIALGEQARGLVDQIAETAAAADVRGRLAALDGPLPRPGAAAAPPRAAGPPPYRLPVLGRLVTGLGEVSASGVRARGLVLAARPGAAVIAPAAGRVIYAQPFRDYGGVVILDHGGGWTTLISGLGRIAVAPGTRLDQGAAIGRAPDRGGAQAAITVELRRRNQPMDLTRLLD